jgi:hypothetical protein
MASRPAALCFRDLALSSVSRQTSRTLLQFKCRQLPNRVIRLHPCRQSSGGRPLSSQHAPLVANKTERRRQGIWTTGRVSLLVALTTALTYLYTQPSSILGQGEQGNKKPKYASVVETEKVHIEFMTFVFPSRLEAKISCGRPSRRYPDF